MINKKILQAIGDKEMDRKDFLKYSGLVLVGLVGLRGVIALLTQKEQTNSLTDKTDQSSRGFGSGKYGA